METNNLKFGKDDQLKMSAAGTMHFNYCETNLTLKQGERKHLNYFKHTYPIELQYTEYVQTFPR